MKHVILTLFALSSIATAQESLPDLKPLQDKYNAAIAAAETSQSTALQAASAPYLSALDNAETKATAAGKAGALKAIFEEKQAVKDAAILAAEAHAELPKDLTSARKTYLREYAKIAQALEPRIKQATAEYLRNLGSVETQARQSRNEPLLKAISEEKIKITETTTAKDVKGRNDLLKLNWENSERLEDGTLRIKGNTTLSVPVSGKRGKVTFLMKTVGKDLGKDAVINLITLDASGESIGGKWENIFLKVATKRFEEKTMEFTIYENSARVGIGVHHLPPGCEIILKKATLEVK
jgi:hypothetical protein